MIISHIEEIHMQRLDRELEELLEDVEEYEVSLHCSDIKERKSKTAES